MQNPWKNGLRWREEGHSRRTGQQWSIKRSEIHNVLGLNWSIWKVIPVKKDSQYRWIFVARFYLPTYYTFSPFFLPNFVRDSYMFNKKQQNSSSHKWIATYVNQFQQMKFKWKPWSSSLRTILRRRLTMLIWSVCFFPRAVTSKPWDNHERNAKKITAVACFKQLNQCQETPTDHQTSCYLQMNANYS